LLCVFLIRYAVWSLKKNQKETFTEMHIPNKFSAMGRPQLRRRTSFLRNISFSSLGRLDSSKKDPDQPYPIFMFLVQLHYRASPRLRLLRALSATLAMFCVGCVIGLAFGFPDEPARGIVARYLYKAVTIADVGV